MTRTVRAVLFITWGLLLFSTGHAVAQAAPVAAQSSSVAARGRWQGGIGLLGGAPVGDFATHVDGAGGLAGHLERAVGQSVFSLGGEIGWMIYGDQSRTVPLGSLIPEVPDAAVNVNTENDVLLLHARLRAQRQTGRWRPYADGLFGFTDLFTRTSITGAVECTATSLGGAYVCDLTNTAAATNSRDFVLSYGATGGVMIGFRTSPHSPRLDLSVRYHRGGQGEYLGEGIQRHSRSRTDMVILYMGVAFGR